MPLPTNDGFFRGFNGLLSLVTRAGGGHLVNVSDVVGLYDYIEQTVASSPVIKETVNDFILDSIIAGNGIIVSPDDSSDTTTISLDTEYAEDLVADLIVAGNDITLNYDDVGGTLTVAYLSGEQQYTFDDNTTLVIVVGSTLTDRAFLFDYTLEAGGNYHAGNVQVIHNGTVSNIRHEFVYVPAEITKLTFSSDISGTDLRLSIQAQTVGSSLKLKLKNRSTVTKTV